MAQFVDASLAFPTVMFSFALLVLIAYWLFAAVTGVAGDVFHGGEDIGAAEGSADAGTPLGDAAGLLAWLGIGGVPVTVVISIVTAVAWFVSLVSVVAADAAGLPGVLDGLAKTSGLLLALIAGWYATWLLARGLHRLGSTGAPARRSHFVGQLCTVRTTRVSADFGQAEVPTKDGSSAIIQVRCAEESNGLSAGSRALIFEYDTEGELFLIAPAEGVLDQQS